MCSATTLLVEWRELVPFLSIWSMWNLFSVTPWANHSTSLLTLSISSSPWRSGLSASPYFDFFYLGGFSLFCFPSLTCLASLLHLCMHPSLKIAFYVFCMSYATTSHLFFFTSMSFNIHYSFYSQDIFKFYLLTCLQIVTEWLSSSWRALWLYLQ